MAAKQTGISIADLQSGSKRLNTVAETKPSKSSSTELDPVMLESLQDLYTRHNGDLDLM